MLTLEQEKNKLKRKLSCACADPSLLHPMINADYTPDAKIESQGYTFKALPLERQILLREMKH